ncbi:hypothetical protein [Amycolatopsis sp. NPDC051372]|uniref:hypothetical protein n=1 Tax=Amycolatopsis sp. NPDC051372 TaxID=3155669 RepID=UPI003427A8A1
MLADWLLMAIVKIVTAYTLPGHRVLILESATYLQPPAASSSAADRGRRQCGPYAGLPGAAWTAARLGRRVRTQTVVADLDPDYRYPAWTRTESESGPRSRTGSPTTQRTSPQSAPAGHDPDCPATATDPDCFDLIVTAAEVTTLDWFRPTAWAGSLAPSGTLAVITHGDLFDGRWRDPAGSLVFAARSKGLRYIDRIALLRVPIRDVAVDPKASLERLSAPALPPKDLTPSRHTRAHDDLLVFTRQPDPWMSPSDGKTSDA